MTSDNIVEISGVNKSFKLGDGSRLVALKEIDFSIRRGSFVSIVGASGSGKSTLLRIINGLIPADNGTIKVNGKAVSKPSRERAMVFQHDSLLPWKIVSENVAYGLTLAREDKQKTAATAKRFIEMVGLKGFENHYPHQLSGGMRQRVNVARGLAVNPDILLLDEPFAALDAQTREIMQTELLRIWQESGKTIILITHQIDEAVLLSDEVLVFSARPGSLRERISIDIPRPRDLETKRLPAFTSYMDHIWKLIEDEVRASAMR